jgi:hypothetical protein
MNHLLETGIITFLAVSKYEPALFGKEGILVSLISRYTPKIDISDALTLGNFSNKYRFSLNDNVS